MAGFKECNNASFECLEYAVRTQSLGFEGSRYYTELLEESVVEETPNGYVFECQADGCDKRIEAVRGEDGRFELLEVTDIAA